MISSETTGAPTVAERRSAAGLCALLALAGLLALTGCVSSGNGGAPPLTTTLRKPVALPARIVTNFFLVEAKQADGRTYRFMIDTGSHATLVTPALAEALRSRDDPGPDRTVLVRGAQGGEVELPAVMLKSLTIGDATFGHVPALIYSLTDLSGQLGMPLDGVIGFPLFRDLLLTLDYPGSRLLLGALTEPAATATGPHSATVPFNNAQNSPLIPIQMGNESFIVLIDSGSDGALSLNPVGLHPRFANGPRVGTLVSSLNGERHQLVGRGAGEHLGDDRAQVAVQQAHVPHPGEVAGEGHLQLPWTNGSGRIARAGKILNSIVAHVRRGSAFRHSQHPLNRFKIHLLDIRIVPGNSPGLRIIPIFIN